MHAHLLSASLSSALAFSAGTALSPQGITGSAQSYVDGQKWERTEVLASKGGDQGCYSASYNAWDTPPHRDIHPQMSGAPRLRNLEAATSIR